jgi:hypothetical protein
VEEIENPMVVDVVFEQGTFEDILRQFDDQLIGPAFVPQYPSRRTTDVRVSARYL